MTGADRAVARFGVELPVEPARERQRHRAVVGLHIPVLGHRAVGFDLEPDRSVRGPRAQHGGLGFETDAAILGFEINFAFTRSIRMEPSPERTRISPVSRVARTLPSLVRERDLSADVFDRDRSVAALGGELALRGKRDPQPRGRAEVHADLNAFELAARLGRVTLMTMRSPCCSAETLISSTSVCSIARRSISTSTSFRSHECTSIAPSKVSSCTSGMPATLNDFVSRDDDAFGVEIDLAGRQRRRPPRHKWREARPGESDRRSYRSSDVRIRPWSRQPLT